MKDVLPKISFTIIHLEEGCTNDKNVDFLVASGDVLRIAFGCPSDNASQR